MSLETVSPNADGMVREGEGLVLVASIRNPVHVLTAALMGAHVATMPYAVMKQLTQHPLTDIGIEKFLKDWERGPDKFK